LPGIKIAGLRINRLGLAVLALLSAHPAVAQESPSPWALGWGDGFKRSTVGGETGAATARDTTQNEPSAQAGPDTAGSETAAQTGQDTAETAAQTTGRDTAETGTAAEADQDGIWQRVREGFGMEASAEAGHADVWQRIRAGFTIDEAASDNSLVGLHESWFAARPENVRRLVERSRPYLFHIVEELDRRAMPMEIALLPMIESAYNPAALSPAAASGIWQFMPATGRHYGLRQDTWYDGRGDFTAATEAALDYLSKLYLDFGDWQLALAAYNCGEGCVTRAIRKNAEEGLPTDYASLSLPNETRHYVPRLLAIKKLIQSPEQYGLDIESLPNQPYFNKVTVHASMDIYSAARLANMSSAEFIALNAAFPRRLIYSDIPVNLLLPVDKVDTFQRNLETRSWESWKPYTAKKGERPNSIAKRFGTSAARLAEHNQFHLKRGKFARTQTILVPVKKRGEAVVEKPLSSTNRHVAQRGDTLFGVALRYGVSVAQLTAANPKLGTHLKVGQVVRIPLTGSAARETDAIQSAEPKAAPRKTAKPLRYTVKRGDNLSAIAQRFDLSLTEIKAMNPDFRKTSTLRTGQTLIVRQP
jgi:membrane-bound lytic murein transglycosylase D